MPHAVSDAVTNGDKASSQFINHLVSYPVVNDGIETYKSNPYGKKSLEIVNDTYTRFGKPVEPYLETPYSYAKPYVQKADELADNGLNHVDSHFPIIKEDTNTIVDTAKGYIFWPYNYLNGTWQDEYKKTAKNVENPGVITLGKAVISTELRIASDFFHTVADILGPKYEETKKSGADFVNDVSSKAEKTFNDYTKKGQDKAEEVTKKGQAKADEVTKKGQAKVDEISKEGQAKADEATKKAGEAKDQAKEQVKSSKA